MPATLMGTSVAVGATTGFRSAWKGAMKLLGILLAATAMTMLSSQVFATTTCERLSTLSLPETTITLAQTVAPGEFACPPDFVGWKSCALLPAHFQRQKMYSRA